MEKIASLLVEKGITPTKQRLELAGLIFNKNQHFTASNLLSKVEKAGFDISQATVYNTLWLFEERGMLKTIDMHNECKFYDTNLSAHHHIYNTESNTITDISNSEIEFSKLPDIPNSLEVEQTEVLIKVKPK
ncbi:MAG: transcriptional repressor [Pseudomonadota bacterium]|nr:transcriptional repressor [Pseudomonadota bacterium]